MQPTESIKIDLPVDIIASMNEAMAAGGYHTPSEIICTALMQWRLQRQWAINDLRRLVDEGIASGIAPDSTIEDIIAEAKRRQQKS